MVNLGIAQWCLGNDAIEAISHAAAVGLRAIQIDAGTDDGPFPAIDLVESRRRYADASKAYEVDIIGVAIGELDRSGMTAAEGTSEARRCWDAIQRAIDGTSAMSVPLLYLSSFEAGEIKDRAGLERTGATLRRASEYAGGSGITLATENTLGSDGQLALLDATGDPDLRILFDTYNPVLCGLDPCDLMNALWPKLVDQIHVKDGVDGETGNAALGTGDGHFKEVTALIRELSFTGTIILENEYADAPQLLARDIEVARIAFARDPGPT